MGHFYKQLLINTVSVSECLALQHKVNDMPPHLDEWYEVDDTWLCASTSPSSDPDVQYPPSDYMILTQYGPGILYRSNTNQTSSSSSSSPPLNPICNPVIPEISPSSSTPSFSNPEKNIVDLSSQQNNIPKEKQYYNNYIQQQQQSSPRVQKYQPPQYPYQQHPYPQKQFYEYQYQSSLQPHHQYQYQYRQQYHQNEYNSYPQHPQHPYPYQNEYNQYPSYQLPQLQHQHYSEGFPTRVPSSTTLSSWMELQKEDKKRKTGYPSFPPFIDASYQQTSPSSSHHNLSFPSSAVTNTSSFFMSSNTSSDREKKEASSYDHNAGEKWIQNQSLKRKYNDKKEEDLIAKEEKVERNCNIQYEPLLHANYHNQSLREQHDKEEDSSSSSRTLSMHKVPQFPHPIDPRNGRTSSTIPVQRNMVSPTALPVNGTLRKQTNSNNYPIIRTNSHSDRTLHRRHQSTFNEIKRHSPHHSTLIQTREKNISKAPSSNQSRDFTIRIGHRRKSDPAFQPQLSYDGIKSTEKDYLGWQVEPKHVVQKQQLPETIPSPEMPPLSVMHGPIRNKPKKGILKTTVDRQCTLSSFLRNRRQEQPTMITPLCEYAGNTPCVYPCVVVHGRVDPYCRLHKHQAIESASKPTVLQKRQDRTMTPLCGFSGNAPCGHPCAVVRGKVDPFCTLHRFQRDKAIERATLQKIADKKRQESIVPPRHTYSDMPRRDYQPLQEFNSTMSNHHQTRHGTPIVIDVSKECIDLSLDSDSE